MRAASRLQSVQDEWEARQRELPAALTYNRKLWTVLATAATNPNHPLPDPIRINIVGLANFIFNHTMTILAEPSPNRIGVLVNINRELATGLRVAGGNATARP